MIITSLNPLRGYRVVSPTPKTRAKRPRAKRPGETTHGRNDPDFFRAKKTFMRKKLGHTMVSAIKASSVTL